MKGLRRKISVFLIPFYLIFLGSCGQDSGQTTPLDLRGLQALVGAGGVFDHGLMLYMRSVDAPVNVMAINLATVSTDGLLIPNGKYEMVALGLLDDGSGNLISKCAEVFENGNSIINLDGGETYLQMNFTAAACAASNLPFSNTDWVLSTTLLPLSIQACDGLISTCPTPTGARTVNSVLIGVGSFRKGVMFDGVYTGPEIPVCIPFVTANISPSLTIPGMDHTDIESGVMRIKMGFFNSSDCSGTPLKTKMWAKGLDFTNRAVGDAYGEHLYDDAKLNINTGVGVDLFVNIQ